MIVYKASKEAFSKDVLENQIEEVIQEQFYNKLGRKVAKNEVRSWQNSMMYMNNVLMDPGIPDDSQVAIEFQIPLTSKRIDFIITGLDAKDKEHVVIIELKQWESAVRTNKDGVVMTRFQYGFAETTHPSYQAFSYASTLQNFHETIDSEQISLVPCAYLHNYKDDDVIRHEFYSEYTSAAPVFLRNDAIALRDFIKKYIHKGDYKDILYRIDNGRIRPSKQLADVLSSMLKGNEEFVLLDDQKLVYETALQMAEAGQKENNKQVLIVKGGPGTGKSVVAINLLVELTSQGKLSKFVSKNAAPRAVYTIKLSGSHKKSDIGGLFGGSGAFIDTASNLFDALIVDEAHRLNLKSGLYQNLGVNQVLEIINATKFSVFFVDDNQRIHIKDVGEVSKIEEWAKMERAQVQIMELKSQFRCNGSDSYLAWLDNALEIRETANTKLSPEEFDFRVFDNPNALRRLIEEKNEEKNSARMVAGYCWNWTSKKQPKEYDVVIPEHGFKMRWNLTKDGSAWIIAENSINEIGCIHTCQGLEVDYIGVVIGDDLVVRNGEVITQVLERSYMDNSIRGIKKMLKENPVEALEISERIIKNTYRTLMTRGMKGCYIYCTDRETREYFKSLLTGYSADYDGLHIAAEG